MSQKSVVRQKNGGELPNGRYLGAYNGLESEQLYQTCAVPAPPPDCPMLGLTGEELPLGIVVKNLTSTSTAERADEPKTAQANCTDPYATTFACSLENNTRAMQAR